MQASSPSGDLQIAHALLAYGYSLMGISRAFRERPNLALPTTAIVRTLEASQTLRHVPASYFTTVPLLLKQTSEAADEILKTNRRCLDLNVEEYIAQAPRIVEEMRTLPNYESKKNYCRTLFNDVRSNATGWGNDPAIEYYIFLKIGQRLLYTMAPPPVSGEQNEIVREIVFRAEHKQAGISILSYFSTIIQQKLPDVDAEVSIRQIGDRVVLSIKHPDGAVEKIEELLGQYGAVVRGTAEAESFLSDPIQALALKHKVAQYESELRFTHQLLETQRTLVAAQVDSLRDEIAFLRTSISEQMSDARRDRDSLISTVMALAEPGSRAQMSQSITLLADAIIKRDEKLIEQSLARIERDDLNLYDKLCQFVLSNSAGGSIGNAAYDLLKTLWPVLLK